MRLGFYPGMKPAEVRAQVEAAASRPPTTRTRSRPACATSSTYQGFQAEGCVVDINQPVIDTLMQCHHDIAGGRCALYRRTATTDVRFFHLYGNIPATCYGPHGADIHGIDEWVSIASLQQVTRGAGAVHRALVRGERALKPAVPA